MTAPLSLSRNLAAFLDMLSVSEGTAGKGDNGYNVLVGGALFTDYADHPRVLVKLRPGLSSTAAGRYQILARIYDAYRQPLGLDDFSPAAQDRIAVQLIRECRALDDIEAGHIATAIAKCKSRWASLPGAGYGQYEHRLENLLAAYELAVTENHAG